MLVIPAIHIHKGSCLRTAVGESGTEDRYPVSPVDVARLWRGENAKALHVVCHDFSGGRDGRHIRVLRDLVDAVDIPVQLGGVFVSEEDVFSAFDDIGVYRIVLDASLFMRVDRLALLLDQFGPRRIVAGLDVVDGYINYRDSDGSHRVDAVEIAGRLSEQGVQRVFVTVWDKKEKIKKPPEHILLCLAEKSNLSVTLNGSVRHYRDLKLLQNLYPRKIDSVVLDEVLYTNAFPCQRIWRLAEQKLISQHSLL
ncbi:MAG: hypothetical protein KFH87_06800 [Bacteroidetes bacterium]|nr:hypothetical protein [Bacteroidota bacterium]